ncbi:hypothetical protein [Christiangramia echinicola]|uniref:hypothetical protein n=1 Tax=Christiangramia echinicola TaxID=279359 RepID=UPI00040B8D82|nr:hypothetical protein [Christiangramia echinicola]
MRLLFTFLIFSFWLNTFSQSKTYNSKLTEYYITQNNAEVPSEWINRDILIDEDFIRIVTKDKSTTEIQTWKINYTEKNYDTYKSNTVYYTNLNSSENEFENPSVFTVYRNKAGKVELIDWQIPTPLNGNKSKTYFYRFHID